MMSDIMPIFQGGRNRRPRGEIRSKNAIAVAWRVRPAGDELTWRACFAGSAIFTNVPRYEGKKEGKHA